MRFLRFITEWGRLAALGASPRNTAVHVVALFLALGVGVWVNTQVKADISLLGVKHHFEATIGWLVAGTATAVWVVACGGAAWVQTRGAGLRMDNALVADMEYRCFRLRLWMGGAVTRPEVQVTHVFDEQGKWLINPQPTPVRVPWSNEPAAVNAQLSRANTEGKTVGVLLAHLMKAGPPRLRVFGADGYQPWINDGQPPTFPFYLRIRALTPDYPHTSYSVSRLFALIPDANVPPWVPIVR